MKTTINGHPAEFTPEIQALWNKYVVPGLKGETASTANYFTPRPYRNEYDRGSNKSGFVFTVKYEVYFINLASDTVPVEFRNV